MARTSRLRSPSDPTIELLLDNLDRAYRGRSWHGTSLRGTLRGLRPDAALWQPAGARNRIWDYLLHAAYWKYIARRRLDPTGPAFPRAGSNFPAVPECADAAALARDVALLDEQHELLRRAVVGIAPATLLRTRGSWRVRDYVLGVAAHDLYHAGQINLLKRLRGR